MTTMEKLAVLQATYPDNGTLERIIDKLVDVALSQHRQRLHRYEAELQEFERRFGMPSSNFYKRFESGELGDNIDFFEWSGLYELRQELVAQINKLELVQ